MKPYEAKTPGCQSHDNRAKLDFTSGLAPARQNQALLESVGKLAAREPVFVATSALGMLLMVCCLIGFGCWLHRTLSA